MEELAAGPSAQRTPAVLTGAWPPPLTLRVSGPLSLTSTFLSSAEVVKLWPLAGFDLGPAATQWTPEYLSGHPEAAAARVAVHVSATPLLDFVTKVRRQLRTQLLTHRRR